MTIHELQGLVLQTIRARRMLSKGERVLVAVSGGVDSVVLLHLLVALKKELALDLKVFHLNHNLRGAQAAGDLAFVRRLAKRLSLPFESRTLKAGELAAGEDSVQEAAREARYRHMLGAARAHKAKRIALGHTLDDQAETVLMRLVKGGGGTGLGGIPPVRGPFVRPLIDMSRAQVEAFARAGKIRYRTDSSNLSPKYLRNDIRLNLIPYLKSRYNPNITASLARLGAILRTDADFIDREAGAALGRLIVERSKGERSKGLVVIDRRGLVSLHDALKARVLMKAIWLLTGESDIYSAHIISSVKLIEGRRPNASIDLPGAVVVRRAYDRVLIEHGRPEAQQAGGAPFKVPLEVPGTTVLGAGAGSFKAVFSASAPASYDPCADVAFFDADSFIAGGPYLFRPVSPGDRMVPFGMSGTRKLKDILMEKRVPPRMRRSIPMLCSADEVIWAVGVRQSDRHRVGPQTVRVVRIEFKKP